MVAESGTQAESSLCEAARLIRKIQNQKASPFSRKGFI
jgi:hypothetical protein